MAEHPLMKCGHTAQAVQRMPDGTTRPACVICMCTEIAESEPDLTGRKARCSYFGRTFKHAGRTVTCHGEAGSKYSLPFFKHKADAPYDEYYCGCFGWD